MRHFTKKLSFSLLFKRRSKIVYLTVINLIILVVLLFDALYFRYFHRIPSVFVLQQSENVQGLGPSILGAVKLEDIVLALPILVITASWVPTLLMFHYH